MFVISMKFFKKRIKMMMVMKFLTTKEQVLKHFLFMLESREGVVIE